jgi:SAM-dependent methyltransferase
MTRPPMADESARTLHGETMIMGHVPTLSEIKQRQQRAWASGDDAVVAGRTALIAERLCDAADLHAGTSVLDVATGSGNAAIAAARHGCTVTGLDYVPSLLECGRVRARAEGFDVRFVEGDAESLPFDDGQFDAVLSCLGVMFAPDQPRAAGELLRVCRPGGTIALSAWTPDSFVAELFRTTHRYAPPPPGAPWPFGWGTEHHIRDLLAAGVEAVVARRRTFTFRFPSAEALVAFLRANDGPTVRAFATLMPPARTELFAALAEVALRRSRLEATAVAIPSDYLEVVAVRTGYGST